MLKAPLSPKLSMPGPCQAKTSSWTTVAASWREVSQSHKSYRYYKEKEPGLFDPHQ
ncbi:hypothetical protein LEMLEM_LOCUS3829 [Lemmus lemmus]